MKLSVVMPCFNERSTVREIIDRVLRQPFDVSVANRFLIGVDRVQS